MAKKKKLGVKLKTFYRGPIREPIRLIDDDHTRILSAGLRCTAMPGVDDLKERNQPFEVVINREELELRVNFGLSSTLRNLRLKRAKAVICDASASPHLIGYLVEFCATLGIPICQVNDLVNLVRQPSTKVKLRKLLVLSICDAKQIKKPGDVLNSEVETIKSAEFENLFKLLLSRNHELAPSSNNEFRVPLIEKIPTKGISKCDKKLAKTKPKLAKA